MQTKGTKKYTVYVNDGIDAGFVRKSTEFSDYLKLNSIIQTDNDESLPEYRIASGLKVVEALKKISSVAFNMAGLFGMEARVVQTNESRIELVNQLGIFYIDGIEK